MNWTFLNFLNCYENTLVKRKRFAKKFAEKIWKCSGKNIKLSKPFEPIFNFQSEFSPSANHGGRHFFEILPPHPPTILVLLRPWFYKPIKRHPKNINWSSSSVANFEHVFVSWGIFKSNHSEKLWKMTLLKHLHFQGNMWRMSSIVTVLFIAKTWNFTKRYSSKDLTLQVKWIKDLLIFRSSRPDMFYKKGVLNPALHCPYNCNQLVVRHN